MRLGPNNLRTDFKAGGFNSQRHLGGVDAGMPQVDYVAWEQTIGRRPIDPIIIGDFTDLTLFAQSGLFSPFRVILNPIGSIRRHQQWTRTIEQPGDILLIGRVPTQYAM